LATGKKYKPSVTAIAQFLALNYIPQPNTIFEGIHHLPPGHMASVTKKNGIKIVPYWRLEDVAPQPDMNEAEAITGILTNLDHATRIRMRSDAPFGAFLSGGLDSSSVVGMMSLYQKEPINTYSIGFDDPRFDETQFANLASRRFATRHQSKRLEHVDAASEWAKFIWYCDQPHGDVSFIPTGKVAELAANHVKMVLTGDGGDELFAGYSKYQKFFPNGCSDQLGENWERRFAVQSGLVQSELAKELLVGKLADAFFDVDPYQQLTAAIKRAPHLDPINQVLFAETTTLLPGNNLVKPDRMAMAHSLEVRSPFLDYKFAEFAFAIPGAMKLKNGETKWIYKKAVEPLLGNELTWRKKQMFTVPIGEWFKNSLTGFSREILFDGRLEDRGLINSHFLHQMFGQHITGEKNYTRELRALISLELWFRIFVDSDDAFSTLVHGEQVDI
jgi:asparagine synthase (glutamine-hydrolysing)